MKRTGTHLLARRPVARVLRIVVAVPGDERGVVGHAGRRRALRKAFGDDLGLALERLLRLPCVVQVRPALEGRGRASTVMGDGENGVERGTHALLALAHRVLRRAPRLVALAVGAGQRRIAVLTAMRCARREADVVEARVSAAARALLFKDAPQRRLGVCVHCATLGARRRLGKLVRLRTLALTPRPQRAPAARTIVCAIRVGRLRPADSRRAVDEVGAALHRRDARRAAVDGARVGADEILGREVRHDLADGEVLGEALELALLLLLRLHLRCRAPRGKVVGHDGLMSTLARLLEDGLHIEEVGDERS